MTLSLFSQYVQASGAAGLLCFYLVMHLLTGLLSPSRHGAKPFLFAGVEYLGLAFERRLNRETRPQPVRFFRGAVVAVMLGALGYGAGFGVQQAGKMTHGWIISLFFLYLCIDFVSSLKVMRKMVRHAQAHAVQPMAAVLQPCLRESLDKSDMHAVIRKAIEFTAESLNRFLMAPVFWFLTAGAVGLALYITYAALYQAFGIKDERHRYFGKVVGMINALMSVIPALLTAAVLMIAALFVSKSNPLRSLSTALGQGWRYRSLYLGWPMAAMAGGLGVTLGGSVRYSADYAEEQPWIGPKEASARLVAGDLARAAILQYVFFLCFMVILSVAVLLNG